MALANVTKTKSETKSEQGYTDNPATMRAAIPADTAVLAAAIREQQKKDIAQAKAAKMSTHIIAAINAQADAAIAELSPKKPFALTVADAVIASRISLVKVQAGTCKVKRLSPTLVRQVAQNAEFVLRYLDEFFAVEQQGAEE